jgi:hypothetical protein
LSTARLDDYINSWLGHPKARTEDDEEELLRLLRLMSLDVRYEDVPTNSVFHGHKGIKASRTCARLLMPGPRMCRFG